VLGRGHPHTHPAGPMVGPGIFFPQIPEVLAFKATAARQATLAAVALAEVLGRDPAP